MKAKIALLILVVCGSLGISALVPHYASAQAKQVAKKDTKKARQAAEKGRTAFVKRDYRTAIENYSQAADFDPDNPEYRFWKGAAHFYLNEHSLAIPELEAAQNKGYKDLRNLYSIRWRSYFAEKNFDAALADVQKGSALDPDNVEFLQASGDLSFAKGDYQSAIDAYQKVIAKNPDRVELHIEIAKAYSRLGDLAKQVAAAEEAVKRPSQSIGEAYLILAEGYQKQRRFDDAIAAYQKAIVARPNEYEAYQNLAELLRNQNRFTEAIDTLRRALRTFSNDGRIYTSLSSLYSLADRNEEAVQAAQAGIRFLPNEYLAYTNLCRALNDVKKPEMAIRECNNALKLKPGDGETYFYLARANDLANKPAEATQYYKQAVTGLEEFTRQNPDSSYGFYLLGNAYFADNQRDKAIDAYVKCLELSPRFVRARYNVAIIQLRQKNKTAALEQYNRLLELDPELAGKLKAEIDKS
ncbi:MAG TPA: tetratricopeptide repeat protein [Pyrinomonadaceae bacterium]